MKILNIQPHVNQTGFGAGVKIKCSENKGHTYLYNEILNLTNEFKIPATFRTEEIELPTVSKVILKKLEDFGIVFNNK